MVRTFERHAGLAAVAVALVATACATRGIPTDGDIDGKVYRNSFFDLSLPVPDGWHPLSADTVERIRKTGEATLSANPMLAAAAKASRSTTHFLVSFSESPFGGAVPFNPVIMLIAEDVRAVPGIRTGSDYIFHLSRSLAATNMYVSLGEAYKLELGGKPFAGHNFEPTNGGIQAYLATVEKDFAISFLLIAQDEAQLSQMVGLISAISFDDAAD